MRTDLNEPAFGELYHRYRASLLSKALAVLGCEHSAKDCLQDVLVSVWTKRGSLHVENLDHYLHQAVRFRALRFRKQAKRSAPFDDRIDCLPDSATGSALVEWKELRLAIDNRIDALPPDQRRIFRLNREQGFTYPQIADLLKISPKTVEKKMSQALRVLRRR